MGKGESFMAQKNKQHYLARPSGKGVASTWEIVVPSEGNRIVQDHMAPEYAKEQAIVMNRVHKPKHPARLHSKDPLTLGQLEKFERNFIGEFRNNYKKALSSGALSDDDIKDGSHTLAFVVVAITGKSFKPNGVDSVDAMARNLEHFI